MALEYVQQQFVHNNSEQRTTARPGYAICREATGGYSITIGRQQLYFESISELDHFLDSSAWPMPHADEHATIEKPVEPMCPLHGQTGADGVRDFANVLARLSSEQRAALARERATHQAELDRYNHD